MRILVIGSGGREHAICRSFSRNRLVEKLFCANGNAGIASMAELVPISPNEIVSLADFAQANAIDLTFVGGETPLALGIVDEFKSRGSRIIGASKDAARLEASKSFAKDFMRRHEIPTAQYRTAHSSSEAIAILNSGLFGDALSPVVVKADGLAAGKGVVVAGNRAEALTAIAELATTVGTEAAAVIVLEECLVGREVSLIMFCDGENFALMPATRDHKRIGDGDTGPNTGGMGTFTDASLLSKGQTDEIIESIVKPTIRGCKSEGFPFCGILFLGLMMTDRGPQVLEYNVRFGDPETQSILIRLETDLVEICEAMLEERLDRTEIRWRSGNSACVIVASDGYPYKARTGDVIAGLNRLDGLDDIVVFHSGTAINDAGEFVTAGGRVLGVTAVGDDLDSAISKAYEAVKMIEFDGMQYRKDIGK
ncbi:MAG TPA: phosphoribosylamine--glycine ligase [Pyrinomonadaceae bacterium]|nr:phosphoribosylamine--glycine ligase [Chloracidobacterium sp.]HBE82975.1 phosphoribosylamine--glycine ligase [Blastocatellia bacterium]HRJ89553.1 phosphoribosylamine--glycine ligase [Pyrinomonadaceae bacterium]HRK50806.1 phosphoribosylamine--glycine ligase [Pyrinomonadaceae bacterium]